MRFNWRTILGSFILTIYTEEYVVMIAAEEVPFPPDYTQRMFEETRSPAVAVTDANSHPLYRNTFGRTWETRVARDGHEYTRDEFHAH